jgi:hypothetical protein
VQEFFRSVDWDKIYNKEIEPPFIPQLSSDYDTSYFDTEFTRETVQLTPPPSRNGNLETVEEEELQNNFVHFSFKNVYHSLRENNEMAVD